MMLKRVLDKFWQAPIWLKSRNGDSGHDLRKWLWHIPAVQCENEIHFLLAFWPSRMVQESPEISINLQITIKSNPRDSTRTLWNFQPYIRLESRFPRITSVKIGTSKNNLNENLNKQAYYQLSMHRIAARQPNLIWYCLVCSYLWI